MNLDVSKVIPSNADEFESQFFKERIYRMKLKANHGICPTENKTTEEALKAIEEERQYRQAMNINHARRREDCLSAEKSLFTKYKRKGIKYR